MLKTIKETIKATIFNMVVAFFIVILLIGIVYLFFGARINETVTLIGKISIDTDKKIMQEPIIMEIEEKRLKNYPEYGTQYGTIEISKIDVNLPVFFGDDLDIIKNGVGHFSGSYFPGENGSIIYMGHNSVKVFRRFSELELDDEILVKTTYGKFKYKIYDMQIIKETELDKLPIQNGKEILMVYTCYPFKNIGYTTQRYVVYAERID